jgi:transposase-like protein
MSKELIKLADAARELGCNVATLRVRVRQGTLPSVRGAHGVYLVSRADLRRQPRVRQGRPRHPRPRLSADELDATWDVLDGLLDTREGRPHVAHAKALRDDPDADPFLHHIVSVHRLKAAGLSYEQVADEIGISARQARRLGRRDLRWSIHLARARHAKKANLEVAKQVAVELRMRLEAEGVRSSWRPSP